MLSPFLYYSFPWKKKCDCCSGNSYQLTWFVFFLTTWNAINSLNCFGGLRWFGQIRLCSLAQYQSDSHLCALIIWKERLFDKTFYSSSKNYNFIIINPFSFHSKQNFPLFTVAVRSCTTLWHFHTVLFIPFDSTLHIHFIEKGWKQLRDAAKNSTVEAIHIWSYMKE